MNRSKMLLVALGAFLALGILVGCSKKEEQASNATEEKAAPAAPATPIDPATVASVSGVVKFDGAAPKAAKIDMSQDPACKGANEAETIVVNDGKLENVFRLRQGWLGLAHVRYANHESHDRSEWLPLSSARARCDDRTGHRNQE